MKGYGLSDILQFVDGQLKPIEKQRVTDQVFNSLVGLLLSGQFKPGTMQRGGDRLKPIGSFRTPAD